LLLSAALVVLGLGTVGAIGGVLLAQIIACVLIGLWAFRAGLHKPDDHKHLRLPSMKLLAPELRYGGVVLVASLAITLQYSIDIVIIKHYFDAQTAGFYAGVAAVARILFFLTASIAQVLISKVKVGAEPLQNQRVLRRSLLLLCSVSAPVLLALVFFPTQVIGLLMGESYKELAGLLPNLSLSVFIVSILNLLAAYHLALRRYAVAVIAAVGAGLTYSIIFLHHGSPAAVVDGLLIGSTLTLVLFGVWKVIERR
jgi:O-antigen/teichoic acid export membrane protein